MLSPQVFALATSLRYSRDRQRDRTALHGCCSAVDADDLMDRLHSGGELARAANHALAKV